MPAKSYNCPKCSFLLGTLETGSPFTLATTCTNCRTTFGPAELAEILAQGFEHHITGQEKKGPELLQYISDDYAKPFRLVIAGHTFKLSRNGFRHLVEEIDRIYGVSESDFAAEIDAGIPPNFQPRKPR